MIITRRDVLAATSAFAALAAAGQIGAASVQGRNETMKISRVGRVSHHGDDASRYPGIA
ncbi:hypothetical protein [Mesorhizobium sp.]|uniref:hypothetical protein n=1 Tax=Mesorhizobium sp. TaxID=1871066 RepID=UPI0025BF18EE|nr:hypothetical protein [Mesorhizobium sp.]